jgi:hypothetical protein
MSISDKQDFETITAIAKDCGYTTIWMRKVAFYKDGICTEWNLSLATALCHAMFKEFE